MIKLENLSKYYYSSDSVALGLRKVNLEFAKGEFVAITGESGSGKTTLLSIISGLLPYEEGEFFFLGEPTSGYDEMDWEAYRKEHIAFVFQNYNLIDSYTVLENVMTSLLIQGVPKKQAAQEARKLLERVGIAECAKQRASQISSGQKQRLAIARALAKNTEIIVADEPTGNLDSENGRQIMELFAQLAKEKLVLIVTHNYEEAEPYVTRKIRMYDAAVAEDRVLGVKEGVSTQEQTAQEQEKSGLSESRIARIFTGMDILARPRRSISLMLFFFITAAASFLFFGNVLANLDDTGTRTYVNDAFYNSDRTRLLVRHSDGSAMQSEDFEFLRSLKYVRQVEPYGLIDDIYYFCQNGVDYITNYVQIDTGLLGSEVYAENIYLNRYNKFVRSAASLSLEDLAAGTLPSVANEVVVYGDSSLLGTTFTCFFNNRRDWSNSTYIRMELTVCGVLKEATGQYYFSDEICKALYEDALDTEMYYYFPGMRGMKKTIYYTDSSYELEEYEVLLSGNIYGQYAEATEMRLIGDMRSTYVVTAPENGGDVVAGLHNSTSSFILLSSFLFEEWTKDMSIQQSSLYLIDYAYMDDTLRTLRNAGYETVCPYRIGSVSYDQKKVREQMVTLVLSVIALLVLFVLEVFIVQALLKNGRKDCMILKSMGMEQRVLKQMNRNMLLCLSLTAFGIMLAAMWLAGQRYLSQIHAVLIYYRFYHVLLLFAGNVLTVLIASGFYNRMVGRLLPAGKEGA